MSEFFSKVARAVANAMGSPPAFVVAFGFVVVWLVSGPLFGYSDKWQLVINTGTTIITFLMVFLIQNAQNRDQLALQLKLDELLKAVKGARTGLVDVESLDEAQLKALQAEFEHMATKHADDVEKVVERAAQDKAGEPAQRAGESPAAASRTAARTRDAG